MADRVSELENAAAFFQKLSTELTQVNLHPAKLGVSEVGQIKELTKPVVRSKSQSNKWDAMFKHSAAPAPTPIPTTAEYAAWLRSTQQQRQADKKVKTQPRGFNQEMSQIQKDDAKINKELSDIFQHQHHQQAMVQWKQPAHQSGADDAWKSQV